MEHHHYHGDTEKKKREKKIKYCSMTFLILAIIMLIPYLAMEFFPFITSIQAHKKINLSTMCYTFLRITLVLMPIVIAAPSKMYMQFIEKIKLIGKLLSLTSFFFFCGLVADIMSYNIFGGYIDVGEDPIMIKMLYGQVGITGIVLCFIEGVLYLLLSKIIKQHKKDVVILFAVTYAVNLIAPFVCLIINDVPFFTKDWYTWFNKNIFIWITNLLTVIGLAIATKSRRVWSEIVWR
ncbi:MAG: hypothetical protein KIG65_02315 [Eubacteriales bacterium]|nr:hypothetical protein [Eubacteriales bacterium]